MYIWEKIKSVKIHACIFKCQHATSLKRIPLPQFCKTKCKNYKVKFENVPFFLSQDHRDIGSNFLVISPLKIHDDCDVLTWQNVSWVEWNINTKDIH